MKAKKQPLPENGRSNMVIPLQQWLELVIVAGSLFFLPVHNSYAVKAYTESYSSPKPKVSFPSPHPLPVNTTGVLPSELTAQGIIVVDIDSGVFLYQKNPDTQLFPASTTKIMTALVALDYYALDETVTVNTVITEKEVMGLVHDEKITVENLLYGLLIPSGNDAAYTLAEHFPGGVTAFVAEMNAKAQILHLTNTHFVNPIGFDDPEQITTPKDLSRLSLFALKNPVINHIAGISQITVSDTTFSYFHALKNVNQLLGKIPGVSGLKTGRTQAAGECLVTTAQKNGKKILIVVLGSQDRFGETEQLLKWTFTNHEWKDLSFQQ